MVDFGEFLKTHLFACQLWVLAGAFSYILIEIETYVGKVALMF